MVTSLHVQIGEARGLFDDLAQTVLGDGRQEVALAMAVVEGLQARQLLEAVEEVRPHGTDQEQRTFRVLQGVGQQRVEPLARRVLGKGEEFLELVDDEQKRASGPV